jgi:hypothetical protein
MAIANITNNILTDSGVATSSLQPTITLTTTGTSGASTLVGATLNIPNYTPDLSGYVTLGTTQTITGAKTFSVDLTVNGIKVGVGGGSGANNTRLGGDTLSSLTSASNNVAVGASALYSVTSGNANVGIGGNALYALTTGTINTAIGFTAGSSITTGSYNTIVGKYVGTATLDSNVVLADGVGNIRFQWDGTNILLNGNIVGSNAYTSTAYLPLTGGTLTGALSGTSATFSSSVTAASYLGVLKDGSDTIGAGAYLVLAATTSSRQWIQQLSASQNLTFYHYTGSAWIQPVTFTSGGNVLIGTSTDSGYKLDVNGTGRYFTNSNSVVDILTLYNVSATSAGVRQRFQNGFGDLAAIKVSQRDNGALADDGQIEFQVASNSTLATKLTILNTGESTFTSTVTATGFFESSDSRLKTLIQDNYQTKGIASITPKLYTKNGKVELGYYAQDFVGILDSAVSKGSDDMLSLSYREVLVAKVYALEQEIKELKAKLN